jgi:carboxyl-terminal processing protease
MSERTKNIITTSMLIILAISAFAAGYVTNDFVELRRGGTLVRERDEFDLFWDAWGYVEASFIGDLPSEKELTYNAIRGAIGALNDPYTIFVEPIARDQERESLQGRYGGIGATLFRPEGSDEIVLEPIPGNPAEIAGILSGDVLLAVDGEPVTSDQSVQEVAQKIRGEMGTTVVLTVRHPGQNESVDITIERGNILIPSVSYRLLPEDATIGYIQLTRFSAESSQEIAKAIFELKSLGAKKLILDLRGNGGGLVDATVSVAGHFLPAETLVLTQQSRQDGERSFYTSGSPIAGDMPLVVLVDGGTASAAEILAGALQDNGRAVLMGSQRTFGKGSVQLVYDLIDGSSVHVTSARWFTPNGHQIDQQGLLPDILVEVTQEGVENGRDEVLARAVSYLKE